MYMIMITVIIIVMNMIMPFTVRLHFPTDSSR